MTRRLIWWGRSDPDYPRNRIVRGIFCRLGWEIDDFRPAIASFGDIEAALFRRPKADLIWVPCFRQRDLGAALRYGHRENIPVIADPLISAWDKQVFERHKFPEQSAPSHRLLGWESGLLGACNAVMVDTPAHGDFFASRLRVPETKLHVLWVGAEEDHFLQTEAPPEKSPIEALFFGSFIGLHGVATVISAARLTQGAPVVWTLLGKGPERADAEREAAGLRNVRFENPIAYDELPGRIAAADIVLGVFGGSEKAGRVIPNKVFQGMACGRPVVTRTSAGFPFKNSAGCGILFADPESPESLANLVSSLAADPSLRHRAGFEAAAVFRQEFGREVLESQMAKALGSVGLT